MAGARGVTANWDKCPNTYNGLGVDADKVCMRPQVCRELVRSTACWLSAGWGRRLLLVGLFLVGGPRCLGDIFHLKSGGRIDGELVEKENGHYRIRTVIGTVVIAVEAVESIETAESLVGQYEQRREQAADRPDEQFALAQWCDEHGLSRERLVHLRRAIELDRDYEPAHRELGHVRVGEMWVDGRAVVERERAGGGDASGSRPAVDNPAKLAAAVQAQWRRQVHAIRVTELESSLDRAVQSGRQKILQIRDPLAIAPIVQELSGGPPRCRDLLVDVLCSFPDDVATVNLAATALAEPQAEIRAKAIAELVRRKDARVVGQLRKALTSKDGVLIRRAAEALGPLRAREAVPELIEVLRIREWKVVEVPVARYFGIFGEPFAGSIARIGSERIQVPPLVAYLNPAGMIEIQRRTMNVEPKVTQVLEALREITGVDFGFEQAEWRRWYEEHK